jgi:hypothetical protein
MSAARASRVPVTFEAFHVVIVAPGGSGEVEESHGMRESMPLLSSVSDLELRERLSAAVSAERAASTDVVFHLAELDRRSLYLEDACSSLFAYCVERLKYSEDGANRRVRVARLAQRFPQILDELASGEVHLTGLFLLSRHLTEGNVEQRLAEARGKSKRQIEELIARWSPQPNVPTTLTTTAPEPAQTELSTVSGAGSPVPPPRPWMPRARLEPLSPESVRLELTARTAFRDKLEQARNLLSHAVPSGDLATLLELGLDLLIADAIKQRSGAGKPRKRREAKVGSRHVPVEVQRAVRERDADQCTFTDSAGRRCSAKRFLTIEHIEPFAKGGPTTTDNCCLLCSAHNSHRARQVFGEKHIQNQIAGARSRREANGTPHVSSAPPAPPAPPVPSVAVAPEPDVFEKVRSALVLSGFKRTQARQAVEHVRRRGIEPRVEPLLRAAIAVLTP